MNDNIITRLVRPVSFVFTLFVFSVMIFLDGNIINIKNIYIEVMEVVLVAMIGALFIGRSYEKVKRGDKNELF